MSVFTTQGYRYRLVAGSGSYADKVQLDLFSDEQIEVSNNITDLFDIGAVPGTFTRTIVLPGTKKNNAFFEQYYDISVEDPDIFATNQKVEAYIDFDGIYLANGYIQLQKVSVYENKFIDSYEVNLFGIVSNFTTDAKRLFLTDLSNLSIYNHTSSVAEISASWQGDLFSGSIRYALTDSGTGIYFTINQDFLGIDENEGSLCVQQFKPAIKLKTVWDAVFEVLGYTYTSSFFDQPMFDELYMLLNNNLKYPVYPDQNLEYYGQFKVGTLTGSYTNYTLPANTYVGLPFNSLEFDYDGVATLGNPITITQPKQSTYNARLNLRFNVSQSGGAGSGIPAFYLEYRNGNTNAVINTQVLANINRFLDNQRALTSTTVTRDYELETDIRIPSLPENIPVKIYIQQSPQYVNNFTVKLNPTTLNAGCSLEFRQMNQAADYRILDVPFNMPYGTSGISLLDFIRGVQKKFNLVLYEDKSTPRQFKVETFNTWYKQGEYKDFNKYVNLNDKVDFIPASSLAVNVLNFTDTLDTDYVSTLWQRTFNRTYGQSILIDTGSYFSQGEFKVQTTFAEGQLGLIPGSLSTGSYNLETNCTTYRFFYTDFAPPYISSYVNYEACDGTIVSQSLGGSTGNNVYNETVCVKTGKYQVGPGIIVFTEGACQAVTPGIASGSEFPIYIPYYVSDDPDSPSARVLPRLMFWNGLLNTTPYWVSGYSGIIAATPDFNNDFNNDFGPTISSYTISNYRFNQYPYFDVYSVVSGSILPSEGSYSILFNNETPNLGSAPSSSLVDTYWNKYLNLLYNPRTRLVNASAVIPLADYFSMELNDIVQFRSNYYHLRAINDYNLTTGECSIQLLGPVIKDAVSNIVFRQ